MRKNEEVFDTSTLLGNVTDDENYAPYEPEEGYEDYAWDEDFYGEDLPDEEGEGFIDEEVIGKDADEDLQLAYAGYSSDYETLVSLLGEILESGEFTEENKENLNTINDDYDESYALVKEEIINAQNMVLENKITEIKNTMLTSTQDAVFDALTNNGEVQGLFKDEDGQIYLNAKFLQTRGMQVVNEDNEVTLSIDDDGNLTTSGDIVGGTITGAVMNAMTINTDTVNITSEDGAMTLEGAMQKFSDENGNVRIKIGKDTDGTFKFVLYGDDGESVLIDKNGIKASAISMGTINVGHLNADVINTIDAKIDNATIDKATIGQLDATNAKIENLKAENATIKNLVANKADISQLNATNATVQNLVANKANISDLNATNATVGNLQANKADITELNAVKGNISQLESEVAKIGTIESDVANIEHILAGNITAENIQTGAITAGSGVIADGAIGSAQISSLDASKITAGKIDTSKVEVAGTNNHLRIKGNRIQVFQGTGNQAKERVSLGDVNGNGTVYGLRVRGADGTTILLDENGVKPEGITDGSITNNKISDDANIDGAKLNINSVVSKINEDGTEVIKGNKIEVDGDSLTAKLSTITNKQTSDGEKITQAQTQITANTNAIKLKVDNQTYQTDKQNMNSQLEKHTSEIGVMKDEINLKVEQTDINKAVDGVREGFAEDINALNKRIDDVLEDIGGAVIEGALDEAKCDIIQNTISQLNKEKAQLLARFEYIYSMSDLDSATKTKLTKAKDTYASTVDRLIATINRIIADKHISPSEKTEYDTQVAEYSTSLTALVKVLEESLQSITNSKINTTKAEIKLTTDAISQNVSNLSQTVSTKADGSTVTSINNKVSSLETSVNGISGKVSNVEKTTTTLSTQVATAQNTADSAVSKADTAQSTANTAKNTANTNKNNITSLQGEVTTVKDNVASLEVTTSGISQKVSSVESTTASLTTQVGNAQSTAESALNKANSANTLAGSKAKVFTTTPTTPYSVGDLWVQGASGDVMRCKVARSSGSYNASDWEKGSKYTDDTKANAVDSKVTTLQGTVNSTSSKVATLETNLNGITQRVSSTESTTATLTTSMNQVDGKINTAKNDAIANAVGVKDTRNTNENPQWYFTNYPKRTVEEFKYANKIGIGSTTNYGVLTTVVPWGDSTGGYPVQTFRSNNHPTYERKGTSDTAWGAWTQVETTSGSQDKATKALNDAKAYTTTEITKTNNRVAEIVTNLDSITQRVSSTESTTSTLTTKVNNAVSTANTASTNATNAVNTANTAKNTADSAKTTATNAQNTANTANTNANQAKTDASSAVSTANSAQSTADSAQSQANTNKNNISTLQTTVNTTNSKVASLETNLNSITSRVSATETTTSNLTTSLNGKEDKNNRVIFARGTGNDYASNAIIKVGNTTVTNGHGRGMEIVALNPSNLSVAFRQTYDTFNGGTAITEFNSKVNELNNGDYIIIVTSQDACYPLNCKDYLQKIGGTLYTTETSTYREAYALIGKSKLGKGNGIEMFIPRTANNKKYADVSVKVSEQGSLLGVNSNNTIDVLDSVNSNVSSLTTRVSTAESKLTKDSLTTTIGNHYTTSTDVNGIVTSKGYQTQSQVQQTVDGLQVKVQQSGGYNLLRNSGFKKDSLHWGTQNHNSPTGGTIGYLEHTAEWGFPDVNVKCCQIRLSGQTSKEYGITQTFNTTKGKKYTISFYYAGHRVPKANMIIRGTTSSSGSWLTNKNFVPTSKNGGNASIDNWALFTHTFTATLNSHTLNIVINDANNDGYMWIAQPMIEEGELHNPYSPHPSEVYDGITSIDKDGVTVTASNVKSKTSMNANGFKITKTDTNEDVFKVNSDGTLNLKGNITVTGGSIPTSNLSGTITANQIASNAITADKIATGAITANKLSADAINGKTITGSNLRGGTFFTAPNSSETDGYAFRIYNDGRVYSKNIIQVYGTAGNNQYAQLKDGVVTATEYVQTSGYKTENSTMRWAINDATVVNPTGDNASRIEFTTIGDHKYFRPCYNGTVRNGSSSYPWSTVYSKSGVNTTSDRTMKENIVYIDRSKNNETVTTNEMYDFIKNDYVLAQYNYIGEKEEKVSAIAQDLLVNVDGTDNKLGQMIVNSEEVMLANIDGEDAKLNINQTQLLNFTIGALQQAMKKIETLEEEIKNLKKEVV